MKKNVVVFGASSDLAKSLIRMLSEKEYLIYGVSSKKVDQNIFEDFLLVDDYLSDLELIIKFVKEVDNSIVIFMNGYLRENRPVDFPNKEEILKTFERNLIIPVAITNSLLNHKYKVEKFIYISSIAAVKLRYKNYIYGSSKKSLENVIKNFNDINFLIFRFGMIKTKMSLGHSKAPFSMSSDKAAQKILNKFSKTGIVYPVIGLKFVAIVFHLLPIKLINFLEKRFLK